MIDRVLVGRLLGLSGILVFLGAAGVLAFARSLPFAGGLVLGYVLGAIPFASWTWIAGRGLSGRSSRLLTVLLLGVKLALYAGVLFVFVTRRLVNPVGVLVGITVVVAVLPLGSLVRAPDRPKEAA